MNEPGQDIRFCVNRFRSLKKICITLKPLTIIIGEAAGKTSLLEALAMIGYGVKHVYEVGREYTDAARIGPLARFIRRGRCGSLAVGAEAWLHLGSQRVGARLSCRGSESAILEYLEAVGENMEPRIHATVVTSMAGAKEAKSRRLAARVDEKYLAPRFYSYDILACENIRRGHTSAAEPRSYLAEDGVNLGTLLASQPSLLVSLNQALAGFTGTEARILADNRISVFAGYMEISPEETSTTVLRFAYYYAAIHAQGPQRALPIVALDNPDAHMGAAAVEALAEEITEATQKGYVILTTHSPLLLSRLAEQAAERANIVYMRLRRGPLPEAEAIEASAEEAAGIEKAVALMKKGPR